MSKFPYLAITPHCRTLIFEYHILEITEPIDSYSDEDLDFLTDCIVNWRFGKDVEVKAFMEYRGDDLHYLVARENPSIDNETFEYFRGVRELDISWKSGVIPDPQYDDAAFVNLRGIHTLWITLHERITDAALVNLRGIHTLWVNGRSQITDSGLANLRGIHTLWLKGCEQLSDAGFANICGVKNLWLGEGSWTDAGFEYLRGIESLYIENHSGFTGEAFTNLRGLKFLSLMYLKQDTIRDIHFRNLTGLEELVLYGDEGYFPRLTGELFKYLEGLQRLKIHGNWEWRDTYAVHLPYELESVHLIEGILTIDALEGFYGVEELELDTSILYLESDDLADAKRCLRGLKRLRLSPLEDNEEGVISELVAYLESIGTNVEVEYLDD